MAEFIILSGKHSGKRLTLSGEEAVIGRDDDCQVRLTSQEISRRHCRIVMTGETIVVTDLGSRNGTKVNGVRCQSKWLMPGDVVSVAKHRYELMYTPTGDAPPPEDDDPFALSLMEKAGLVQPGDSDSRRRSGSAGKPKGADGVNGRKRDEISTDHLNDADDEI
ncbi:MAG: FHA domain-containing protein [Planctomycetes bacterium]|nr:FHA domain-containing protein [Planctomycetota bacterium]